MTTDARTFLKPINFLLGLIAFLNIALTFYSVSRFYTYLPTSDAWIYTNFLVQAAQGQLDMAALFERHNGIHFIALPKIIYFFDMWLTQGSGAVVMLTSLSAMMGTAAIFMAIIFQINTLDKQEKFFLSLGCATLLMSACQAESLMNPANLQWSLLVFTATLTAWFFYRYWQKKSAGNIAGIASGAILTSLTSAPLLVVVPFGLLMIGRKHAMRAMIVATIFVLAIALILALFFRDYLPVIPVLLANGLKFVVDFLVPPVERLHSTMASFAAALLVLFAISALWKASEQSKAGQTVFFEWLLLFSLAVILATGVVRSYSPAAFTFRFVNIGLLFAASLFPLLQLQLGRLASLRIVKPLMVAYVVLLSYVNVTEVSAFGFGRNHIKLTQVAHALDIRDSFVVSAMPGTIWEKEDFDYVQANKHKLQEVGAGIYHSEAFKNVGKPVSALALPADTSCKTTIIKMRRLLPDQAAYRLLGETRSDQEKVFSRVYFADDENIIRGFAVPVEPGKNILENLFLDEQWAGFVNLDVSREKNALMLYAYRGNEICRGEKIELPEYRDLRKKSETTE